MSKIFMYGTGLQELEQMMMLVPNFAQKMKGSYFSKAHLYGIDTDGYALFQMAKTIVTGKKSIEINEIADEQLIGNSAFKAIINATLIAKYGGEILTVRQ